MNILGISCFYHDSAATLVVNGKVVAAVAEERFSRDKHDNSFPENAIRYCLSQAEFEVEDIDKVVFYEKPIQKFDRILETAAVEFPKGYRFFSEVLPEWLGTKLRLRKFLRKKIGYSGKVEFREHHYSHAASAFYPSPFNEAAILTVDGVGEWKTNQTFKAEGEEIKPLEHIKFPNSIGLLYSTITSYLGFMVNNDEYKVMGLASYGEPVYREEFEEFIEINSDGSYEMDQDYFSYTHKKKMWSKKLENILGKPRENGEKIQERHKNIAATLQKTLEEVLLKQVDYLYRKTNTENLCMAGGVALNSAANGKLRKDMPFKEIWIQPAAGDAGGSMGAALAGSNNADYSMENCYLGPKYSSKRVKRALKQNDINYRERKREEIVEETADRIAEGEVIGLYRGRTEWGPRALGNRSILADPRREDMVDIVNKKVKFRENFRPFAPTVIHQHASDYFEIKGESPYMLFVFNAHKDKISDIPAVTHVDNTSRIQTLKRNTNPFYYDIIERFYSKTGVPVLLNTSFNLKGMPIVNKPKEAIKVLQNSDIDAFVTRSLITD